ncbi:MAG: HNH endonuclease [Pseudomonadales bacterium]|nr:HNH endonuclease [Pseudomonadales bacterium]
MTRRPWTDAERDVLRALYADTPTAAIAARLGRSIQTVYTNAYKLGLKKTDTFLASGMAGRTYDGRGASTRFAPGHRTWNKGRHYIPGGRAPQTQFKPGNRPHTWRPVGTYRVRHDGYLEVKLTDTGYTPHDWRAVHRAVWEAEHGPTPAGHIVVFKPGRRTAALDEITLDAVELITRQELMRRNSIMRYPPELRQTMKLLAKVKRTIRGKDEERHG